MRLSGSIHRFTGNFGFVAAIALFGCSNATNDAGGPPPALDAGSLDAAVGTPSEDAASFDAAAAPAFIAHFSKADGQLPEGLWRMGAQTFVGWAPLAALETVTSSGSTQTFAALGAASNTFTLGITSNTQGDVYVGVGAAAVVGGAPASATPVAPAPGVYVVPGDGGAPVSFSLGSNASPAMRFPNGLAFLGSDLFVADSEGIVYKVDATGAAAVWSHDPSLAPSQPACAGVVPLAIGANGIASDGANVYVTNTNYGRVLAIPIAADGSAGAVRTIAEDCATLAGADGIAIDHDGSFLVAINAQNRIARVQPGGSLDVVLEGAPLDTPASLFIDEGVASRRLLITNSSFFSAADAGAPGLLALPLP